MTVNFWKRESWRLTWTLSLGFMAGSLVNHVWLGIVIALAGCLAYHLVRLHALVRWLLLTPHQQPPAASGTWGEVFDRLHRHQKAQQITHQRLRTTLARIQESSEAMRDSVVMLDRHGDLEWWNSAASQMLGLRSPQDRGQHITNLLRDPSFVSYLNAQDYREPLTLASPIDDRRMLQFQLTLYGDNERLLMARDITRLHRLEQMRRDFVANVSHELRTPLTVLTGYLETYADLGDHLPARLKRGIDQMQSQATRMQHLVNDLLMLSRLEIDEGGKDHQAIRVADLLAQVLEDASGLSEGRHELALETEAGPEWLFASEQEVRSAISNLAFNAVRYCPEGSRIVLRWGQDAEGGVLDVEDNGDGMDPVHLPRLTERFYRIDKGRSTETGGTGLGLAIVKHVLLRHQGWLQIDSAPGQGALFRCHFPAKRLQETQPDGSRRLVSPPSALT